MHEDQVIVRIARIKQTMSAPIALIFKYWRAHTTCWQSSRSGAGILRRTARRPVQQWISIQRMGFHRQARSVDQIKVTAPKGGDESEG